MIVMKRRKFFIPIMGTMTGIYTSNKYVYNNAKAELNDFKLLNAIDNEKIKLESENEEIKGLTLNLELFNIDVQNIRNTDSPIHIIFKNYIYIDNEWKKIDEDTKEITSYENNTEKDYSNDVNQVKFEDKSDIFPKIEDNKNFDIKFNIIIEHKDINKYEIEQEYNLDIELLKNVWDYKNTIHIDSEKEYEDIQIPIKIKSEDIDFDKIKNTGDDLRFTINDSELIPHYIEYITSESILVWTKIPEITDDTNIQVYYGNDNADDITNPESVFLFYDKFTDFDTDMWSDIGTGDGNIFVNDEDKLIITNTEDTEDSNGKNRGAQTDEFNTSIGQIIESRSKTTRGRHNTFIGFSDSPIGYSHGSDIPSGGPYGRLDTDPTTINLSVNNGDSGASTTNESGDPSEFAKWRLTRKSNSEIELHKNNELIRSLEDENVPQTDIPLYFGSDGYTSSKIVVDWVRVRKYIEEDMNVKISDIEEVSKTF